MIQFKNVVTCIDTHTLGEPLRLVTSGIPPIPGATILEKRAYFKDNLDHFRKLLMLEPRGHADMYGCVLVPPVTPDGDFGTLFIHNEGHGTMCGHGCIAVSTAVFDTGMMTGREGVNELRLDTPAGRVTSFVYIENGRVKNVTFQNVPTFVHEENIKIPVEGVGEITGDLVFGGDFYVYADANQLGLEIRPENAGALARLAVEIKHKVLGMRKIVHPLEPKLNGLYGTILTSGPEIRGNRAIAKNICVFADGEVDRSPCGTGTSGRFTQLYAKGTITGDMVLEHHSVIDTVFEARMKEPAMIGDKKGIVATVTGSAHIMGFNQIVLDPNDPLPDGFHL
jgi:proline racemase